MDGKDLGIICISESIIFPYPLDCHLVFPQEEKRRKEEERRRRKEEEKRRQEEIIRLGEPKKRLERLR